MNQRLLKPVHQGRRFAAARQWMVLTKQNRCFFRLVLPSFDCFSFDLKSATERWSLRSELLHFFHLATLHSLTGFGRATATFLER
jgi:hypothetical protein